MALCRCRSPSGAAEGTKIMQGYRANNSAQLRSEQKARVCYDVSAEINPIKSRLIEQLSKLERADAKHAAASLGRIIGDLEAWQAKNG